MLVKEYIFNPENSKYKDMSKEALLKKIDILERYIKHKCNDCAGLVKENAFLIQQLERVKDFNVNQVFSSKPLNDFIDQIIKEVNKKEN